MASGQWTIVIQANNHDFAVMRKFSLTIAAPEKTVVTVRTPCLGCTVRGGPFG